MAYKLNKPFLPDLNLALLNADPDDKFIQKILMLIDGVYRLGVKHSTKKYGYAG